MKRRRAEEDETPSSTPRKSRRKAADAELEDEIAAASPTVETPSRNARGKLKAVKQVNGISKTLVNGESPSKATPRSQRKVLFATPQKPVEDELQQDEEPTIARNADHSARRKSARRVIERTITDEGSDAALSDEEDILAQQIWDEDGGAQDENEQANDAPEQPQDAPETPSKRPRGRPKGKRKARSPTPPQNLPPHEQYFWQNRPSGTKTSNNTLPSHLLLNHEEYLEHIQAYKDPHEEEQDFLLELHERSFDQWLFELREGFNLCLFGYGSKKRLTEAFAEHAHFTALDSQPPQKPPGIIVVNGYDSALTVRDILSTLASTIIPKNQQSKLPNQPTALLDYLETYLSTNQPPTPILVLINSIDAPPLRRTSTQSLLSTLAAHRSISLLATVDTPSFPLMWDISLKQRFNFLFHDCTTHISHGGVEIEDVVGNVNELLGRSGRRIGGRDGVGFVLRSLPENARGLFRILVAEQLAAMDADGLDDLPPSQPNGIESDDDDALAPTTPSKSKRSKDTGSAVGIEWRVLYHKAVEEFLCSSEMAYRGLLKEFHDHQMVESRRDAQGTERLWVPFRREELESLVDELVGGI